MTIDEKGLDAALAEAREQLYVKGLHEDEELAIIIAIIEAYEAARPDPNPWRPIEEAPRDGSEICIHYGNHIFELCEIEEDGNVVCDGGGGWMVEDLIARHGMFRTIDPPPQNDPQSAVDAPTAAEGAKPFISIHDEISEPGDRRMDQETPRTKS